MSKASKSKSKANEAQVPDDGMPRETVTFKIAFTMTQSDLTDTAVLFQWIDPANPTSRMTLTTDMAKEWTKASPTETKKLSYTKEFAPALVEENFVKNLCSDKFQVLFVSKVDSTVLDKIELHYSSLLFPTTEPKFEFSCTRFSIPNIESFTVTLTANKPLLSIPYRQYLNPLLITVEAAKNLPTPIDKSIEYMPAYVVCKFFDDTVVKTHSIPISSKCKWMHKQVILVGLMSPVKLTASIRTSILEFQVHDRDEIVKPKPPKKEIVLADIKYEPVEQPVVEDTQTAGKKGTKDAKKPVDQTKGDSNAAKKPAEAEKKEKAKEPKKVANNLKGIEPVFVEDTRKIKTNDYGVAQFTLAPFVETDMTSLKLRRNIIPIHKYEKEEKEDSDTDGEAKKKQRDNSPKPNYFEKESYLTVSYELAYPLGPLDPIGNSPVKKTTRKLEEQNYSSSKTEVSKASAEEAQKGIQVMSSPQLNSIDASKLKFERAVCLFSTKLANMRNEFLKEIRAINLETFGKDGSDLLYLGFKTLTEEEKKNTDLDIITGVEFIDKEYHTFILEGLAEKAMKRLGKLMPVSHPFSNDMRIIKNSEFKFENRLYIDFGVDIKKIWFTKNISELLCQPEIYIRSKVSESVYQTLKTINEIRKCHNLKGVFSANLFPFSKDILVIAQMYGDTSMYEDLNGNKTLKFKEIDLKSSSICKVPVDPTANPHTEMDVSIDVTSSDNRRSSKSPSVVSSKQAELLRIGKISSDIQKMINKSKFDLYYLHCRNPASLDSLKRDSVFIQGNQSLNYYEGQRAEMRKSIRQDPNNFYTYSPDYMSAAIDPYVIDEVKKEEAKQQKKQWKTPEGFQNAMKKNLNDYISHPMKPTQEKIKAMYDYPWYVEKEDQEKRLKQVRGSPIKSVDHRDFDLSPRASKGMSSRIEWENPESPFKEIQEKKNKPVKTSRTANPSPASPNQLEPLKGVKGSPGRKVGMFQKEKEVGKERSKDEAPISIFLGDKWKDKRVQYPVDREFDRRKSSGASDFDVVIQNPSQLSPVYRRKPKCAV